MSSFAHVENIGGCDIWIQGLIALQYAGRKGAVCKDFCCLPSQSRQTWT
jgi:hypothetical protein